MSMNRRRRVGMAAAVAVGTAAELARVQELTGAPLSVTANSS